MSKGIYKIPIIGYSGTFKRCIGAFFKNINNCLSIKVHFEDIEYLDGYFIFRFGSNSVVHFHIRECPGWKFAIWRGEPHKNNSGQQCVDGDFFAQYEEVINKFKPSDSNMSSKIKVRQNTRRDLGCDCWDASKIINFIKTEPFLAFCRDYNGWDYNHCFHTREEAKQEYDEWRCFEDNRDKFTKRR